MSLFYHKLFLCFATNRFFVLLQIISLFYHQSFLVLPQIISKCMTFSERVIVVYSQLSSFLAISWREQFIFQWDDYYSVSSLKQQFADRHVSPLEHIILIQSQAVFTFTP